MKKKFELLNDTHKFVGNVPVYRIKALKSFSDVTEGDLGGWIHSESNLSQENDCWVYDESTVTGNIEICENATVRGQSKVHGLSNTYIGSFAKIADSNINLETGRITVSDIKSSTINGGTFIDGCSIDGASTIYSCNLLNCDIKGDVTIQERATIEGYSIAGKGILISGKNTKLYFDESTAEEIPSPEISGENIKIIGGTFWSSNIIGDSVMVTNGVIQHSVLYDNTTISGGIIHGCGVTNSTIYNGTIVDSELVSTIVLDDADIAYINIKDKTIVGAPCIYGEEGPIKDIDGYRTYGPVTINSIGTAFEEQITLFKCEEKIFVAFSYKDPDTGYTPCLYYLEEFIKECPLNVQKILNILKEDLEC